MPITAQTTPARDVELIGYLRAAGSARFWYEDFGGEEYRQDWIAFTRLANARIYGSVPDIADLARYATNGARWLSE